MFSGVVDENFVRVLQQLTRPDGAAQPVRAEEAARLRRAKTQAQARWRQANRLAKRVSSDGVAENTLQDNDLHLLHRLRDGSLVHEMNEAVQAYGHGRIRRPDGTFTDIGSNTGDALAQVQP